MARDTKRIDDGYGFIKTEEITKEEYLIIN
jgi:hypothetical protein